MLEENLLQKQGQKIALVVEFQAVEIGVVSEIDSVDLITDVEETMQIIAQALIIDDRTGSGERPIEGDGKTRCTDSKRSMRIDCR